MVKKFPDADRLLNAGKSLEEVLQALEASEATYRRWRNQHGGMQSKEAKQLKTLEEESSRLKKLMADLSLDNQMLKEIASGNWRALLASGRRSSLWKRPSR